MALTKFGFLKGSSDTCFYAFDEDNKVITIANISQQECQQINLDDIIKMDILEDNTTTVEKSLGGTIGRILVGGALAGNAGAIIGGTTGKSSINTIPEKIVIKFSVKDTSNPSCSIVILDSHNLNKNSKKEFAPKAKAFAMDICDIVTSYKAKNKDHEEQASSNIDKLAKLAELKEKGFVTEEFNAEKKKLLG